MMRVEDWPTVLWLDEELADAKRPVLRGPLDCASKVFHIAIAIASFTGIAQSQST